MHQAARKLQTQPQVTADDSLARCLEECLACALVCATCAGACLADEHVEKLVRCIQLNLDCADACDATGRVLARQAGFEPALARSLVEACALACSLCAAECELHAREHEHCRVCAEACRRCEQACNDLASVLLPAA